MVKRKPTPQRHFKLEIDIRVPEGVNIEKLDHFIARNLERIEGVTVVHLERTSTGVTDG